MNDIDGIKRVEYADSIDAIRFTFQDGHKARITRRQGHVIYAINN